MSTLLPALSRFASLTASITLTLGGEELKPEPAASADDLTPPRVLKRYAPFYPDRAILRGLAGVVLLEVPVDMSGRVGKPSVLKSSGSDLLDVSAVCCVRKWRFKPARRKNQTCESVWRQEIRFKLPPPERIEKLRRAAKKTEPLPGSRPYPPFPRIPPDSIEKRSQRLEGELEITWTADGHVATIKLLKSTGCPELDLSALGTVFCQWRLDTARFPVGDETVYLVRFAFEIHGP